ncbi:hypothetical protein BS78_08G046500 [Paspalum vaginatum]|nr:hypothetical protein BS78_08G046500 [Paspalum vaginatum]
MMRASQQAPPQPQPLPPPPLSLPSPPAAPRRGRHRSSYSSSSCSSSVSSSASTFCPSPPSPAASPRASRASLVPFSWERHPGVPKTSSSRAGTQLPLPLPPPPLTPAPRCRRRRPRATAPAGCRDADDPFVAAFAECTRDDDYADAEDDDKLWPAPAPTTAKQPAVVSGRADHRWWVVGGGLVAFLDLHGCKGAMDVVADGTFRQRRLVVAPSSRPPVVRAPIRKNSGRGVST